MTDWKNKIEEQTLKSVIKNAKLSEGLNQYLADHSGMNIPLDELTQQFYRLNAQADRLESGERLESDLMNKPQGETHKSFTTTVMNDEYQIALSMANESARIRLHRVQGTDNVWHLRCYPADAFLTEFDLGELRDVIRHILNISPFPETDCPNCHGHDSRFVADLLKEDMDKALNNTACNCSIKTCGTCGTRLVRIRGRQGTREVCAQCAREKLDKEYAKKYDL